jgi:hypothetical protein
MLKLLLRLDQAGEEEDKTGSRLAADVAVQDLTSRIPNRYAPMT